MDIFQNKLYSIPMHPDIERTYYEYIKKHTLVDTSLARIKFFQSMLSFYGCTAGKVISYSEDRDAGMYRILTEVLASGGLDIDRFIQIKCSNTSLPNGVTSR